ncbi:MAG: hypothetical protein U0K83_02890 [Bacteroidales bacterium]|nr:hypothetical protein [Bacteroidales bacterium]
MNANDKLEELIIQAIDTYATMPLVNGCRPELKYFIVDHLLANGVVVVDTNIVSPKNRPLISQCLGRPIGEIIELVNAKDEGRILVLPCKVGDTVYAIVETTCEDIDFVHTVCEFYNEEHEDLCTLPKGKCPYKYIIQKYSVGPMNLLHFSEKFGKTVFLSRELAEKALAERSKNGNL